MAKPRLPEEIAAQEAARTMQWPVPAAPVSAAVANAKTLSEPSFLGIPVLPPRDAAAESYVSALGNQLKQDYGSVEGFSAGMRRGAAPVADALRQMGTDYGTWGGLKNAVNRDLGNMTSAAAPAVPVSPQSPSGMLPGHGAQSTNFTVPAHGGTGVSSPSPAIPVGAPNLTNRGTDGVAKNVGGVFPPNADGTPRGFESKAAFDAYLRNNPVGQIRTGDGRTFANASDLTTALRGTPEAQAIPIGSQAYYDRTGITKVYTSGAGEAIPLGGGPPSYADQARAFMSDKGPANQSAVQQILANQKNRIVTMGTPEQWPTPTLKMGSSSPKTRGPRSLGVLGPSRGTIAREQMAQEKSLATQGQEASRAQALELRALDLDIQGRREDAAYMRQMAVAEYQQGQESARHREGLRSGEKVAGMNAEERRLIAEDRVAEAAANRERMAQADKVARENLANDNYRADAKAFADDKLNTGVPFETSPAGIAAMTRYNRSMGIAPEAPQPSAAQIATMAGKGYSQLRKIKDSKTGETAWAFFNEAGDKQVYTGQGR